METILTSHDPAAVNDAIQRVCITMMSLFVTAFIALTAGGQKAGYGRYSSGSFGPTVPGIVDWYFHATSLVALTICMIADGFNPFRKPQAAFLLLMFAIHYVQRSFMFAWQMDSTKVKPIPVVILLMGSGVCWMNGLLNSRYLTLVSSETVHPVQLLVGSTLWFLGFYGNVWHDRRLLQLKKESGGVYVIPTGGLFDYVSGANFFCEIMEWLGYAIASNFSPPSSLIFFISATNIGPRGLHHHKFYLEKFPDYPKSRKAIIPFVL